MFSAGLKLASHRSEPLVKAAAKAGRTRDQEPLYALSAGVLLVGVVPATAG
jgi:hypothetical protein